MSAEKLPEPEYYWAAYEWHHHDRVKLHFIKSPKYNEPKWYVSVISSDSFNNREAKRHYEIYLKGKTLPLRFHMMRFHEYKFNFKGLEKHSELLEKEKALPTQYHESIWNFYKAVGWDYKNKKYIPVVPDTLVAPLLVLNCKGEQMGVAE